MRNRIYLLAFALLFTTAITAQNTTGWNWAHTAGSHSTANSIARDANGNVYVTGTFDYPTITLGGKTVRSEGGTGVFIAKYNSKGEVLWLRSAGEREADEATGIATDPEGNVYITGTFTGATMIFDSVTITGVGSTNFFVAKYTTDGYIQWARTSTKGGKYSEGGTIAVDDDGNAYIAGTYRGPQFFIGNNELPFVKYYYSIFICRYDSEGNLEWVQYIDGPGIEQPLAMAVKGNDLYLAGGFTSGGIDFPNNTLLSNLFSGRYSMFLTKQNGSTGSLVWSRNSRGICKASGICIGAAGELYVSGVMMGDTLRIGNTTLTDGPNNAFIAQYNPQGTGIWAKRTLGSGITNGPAIATNRNGLVYIAGAYSGTAIQFDTISLSKNGTPGSSTDLYVAAYDTTGQALWALGVGGSKDETVNSIVAGENRTAYIAGSAASPSFFMGIKEFNCDSTEALIAKIGEPTIGIGITETENTLPLNIYPNPTTGQFTVSVPLTATQVEVLTITGQVLQTQTIHHITTLPLSIKASGVYFVRVTDGKNSVVRRVVVM